MKKIGSKIKALRKRNGLSQEELAELAGLNLRTIQRIEKDQSQPRGKTLQLICEVLHTSVDEVLNPTKQEDKKYLGIVHLSVLAFMVFPMGNIIVPLIFWITKKDTVMHLDALGKNILNFQILWTILISISAILLILDRKFFNATFNIIIILILINIITPIILAIGTRKGNVNVRYPNFLKFIG